MGWSSGYLVFDYVVEAVLKTKCGDNEKRLIISRLVEALTDQDWDTVNESLYYDHELVKSVLIEHDLYYEDEE